MIPSPSFIDADTRQALLTDSRELDFRALLRALRERVVDVTGLIEDGSAANAWEPVLGRHLDSPQYRTPLRPVPVERGAPDLVRLFNHLAIRLGSFLLAHHDLQRHGEIAEQLGRRIHWKGRWLVLRAPSRGHRYELVPPVPVDVLPGRNVRSRGSPAGGVTLAAP